MWKRTKERKNKRRNGSLRKIAATNLKSKEKKIEKRISKSKESKKEKSKESKKEKRTEKMTEKKKEKKKGKSKERNKTIEGANMIKEIRARKGRKSTC